MDYSVVFRNEVYTCSSPEAMDTFQKNPLDYIHPTVPPLRVLLFGGYGCDIGAVAKHIVSGSNCHHVNFAKLAEENGHAHVVKAAAEGDMTKEQSESVVELMQLLFEGELYKLSGFVLEDFPRTFEEVRLLHDKVCLLSLQSPVRSFRKYVEV